MIEFTKNIFKKIDQSNLIKNFKRNTKKINLTLILTKNSNFNSDFKNFT
jgi:hypothetical protein